MHLHPTGTARHNNALLSKAPDIAWIHYSNLKLWSKARLELESSRPCLAFRSARTGSLP